MTKDLDNFRIIVYEVGTILFIFQLWASAWHKKKIIIYINNKMAVAGLEDLML